MTFRRSSRWVAGFGVFCAMAFAAAPNRAAEPKPDPVKWATTRTTFPEDIDELKALQARVKTVVDERTPDTVGILIGFGAGSGVIVSEDGLVLTAAHVIVGGEGPSAEKAFEPGKDCLVVLPDGSRKKAKTLGINSRMDSGMIKIIDKGPNDGKWPFAPIAKSADVKKGQWVVSLGHPGGPKAGRPPVARLGRIENNTKDLVRSNCTLVGGDSGGPLFDLDGKVIGIHSRIGLSLAQNIHVPADQFKAEWDRLAAGEVIGRKPQGGTAAVGVVFPEDDADDAWLNEVEEGGPAGKAGLKPGDTITKVNGTVIKSVKQFRDQMKDKKPGEVLKVTVRRGTETQNFSITLGKRG